MSSVPANSASLLVAISGVVQDPTTYSVSGNTLTFSTAPPSGSGNISVRYLGIASVGTVGSFSAGTTGFTPASATTGAVVLAGTLATTNGGTGLTAVGSNGQVLTSNGTTLNWSTPVSTPGGSNTQIQYNSGGAFAGSANFVFDGTNVGIGTTSPAYKLDVVTSGGTSYLQVKGASSGTSITTPGNGGATIFLRNTDSTANNFSGIYGSDGGDNVTNGIAFINNSDANNEGTMAFMNRPSGGSLTERMRIDSSGNVFVGGTTQNTSTAPVYASNTAKAWVNYNVSGGSSSVRGSFNVSSVTYNSTGVSTVNFTNAMANTNYATVMSERPTSDTPNPLAYIAPTALSGVYTTSAVTVRTAWSSSPQNPDIVCVIIFGT
jgi:hypothetical protein